MFQNPFLTARRVEIAAGVTAQGARNLLERAEKYGWLEYAGISGRGGRQYYSATEVLRAIEAPTVYSRN